MKYILLTVVFATVYGYPYGAEILVSVVSLFASIYYYLAFKLAAGLNNSILAVDDVKRLQATTLAVFANGLAVSTLIMETQYAYVGWVSLPWIALSFMTTVLSWLVYFELVEIKPKESEE